jgi:hemerythrin-like domain-containing protein
MKKAEIERLPAVLRCLFEEHRHMEALTRVLTDKASQSENLEPGDAYLLRDVVAYLHDYPDQVHHPTENLLFEAVVKRDPGLQGIADHLREDHAAAAALTQSLLALLDRLIEAPGEANEQAVRSASLEFARRQRAHMRFENNELFPVAIDCLSRSDWQSIERHFERVEDPLFGRTVASRHRLLYEYLLGHADRAESGLAGIQQLGLERLMLSAGSIEEGIESGFARVLQLGDEVVSGTRSSLAQAVQPESVGKAVTLPARYSLFLARSVLGCGKDLGRIWVGTVFNAVKALGTGAQSSAR